MNETIAFEPSIETDALVVNGVSHRFGDVVALDNVSLEVPREILGRPQIMVIHVQAVGYATEPAKRLEPLDDACLDRVSGTPHILPG